MRGLIMKGSWSQAVSACAGAALVIGGALALEARQQTGAAAQREANQVAIDADDIGGVATGPGGPEAGVWVIAETSELPTMYRKIVVTDDRGRFVLPDLPGATYRIWLRGYGLVDSEPVSGRLGQRLALAATPAPDARAAAQYYPANYWHSLLRIPPDREFPMRGTGDGTAGRGGRGGAAGDVPTQGHWIAAIKGCVICHQMGTKITREISPAMGVFESSVAAWNARIRQGQSGAGMLATVTGLGRDRALSMYADWTDRIAAGEVPPAPPRPQGVERNVVVTLWDIATPTSFIHDMYQTDRRNPTVNGYGPVIASDFNRGSLWVLDPLEHGVKEVKMPYRDDLQLIPTFSPQTMERPSLYWGGQLIAQERQKTEVQMVDAKGRLWMMLSFRRPANPDWCKAGSTNRFAQYFPLEQSGRQAAYYDIRTGETRMIDTCFTTHHGAFAEDADDTMYNAALGLPSAIGWVKTRVFDQTGDEVAAQGWCPAYYDINGSGRYERASDRLIAGSGYFIAVNPMDGSVWYAVPGTPGKIVRVDVGPNPPDTCRSEAYEPPFYNAKAPDTLGYLPRGIDVDLNGLVWTGLAGSGHLASFDRSKCAIKEGPGKFDPQHCSEGWTLYAVPGPQMQNVTANGSADFMYSNWVDRFDTFGLGRNVPFATGTGSDSLLALTPDRKQWVVLRVPYPMGFYTRSMSGRIDDPMGGWKGRGLWAANEVRNPWHIEGGKGTRPQAVHIQLRPDPLAH
ncbi:MAG: carboxypeptidase regulatory-like domain-containing protein [Acidobacteria bacterium]|nr:carboxypeptidase regulatory-like domain-containing protein [Acidobacteriota bacterium]